MKLNLDDPAIRKVLRNIYNQNLSDPFAVPRFICYVENGLIEINRYRSEKANFKV